MLKAWLNIAKKLVLFSVLSTTTVEAAKQNQIKTPKPQIIQYAQGQKYKDTNTQPSIHFPITYNARVRYWINYFQTSGKKWFQRWLERSTRYLPTIITLLRRQNLPTDLAYVAMIESGFNTKAESSAQAVGMWQFIRTTGQRYGLKSNWWIDERRDFLKSTHAAIRYKKDLYRMFGSWYLVAASYNTGENRIKRLTKKHNTMSFWHLADLGVLAKETTDYVPKIIAATLIARAPALYGFRQLEYQNPLRYEYFHAPGGTNLYQLAQHIGVKATHLKELNPELIRGYIPRQVSQHRIRIPRGSTRSVSKYVRNKKL